VPLDVDGIASVLREGNCFQLSDPLIVEIFCFPLITSSPAVLESERD
jgi:hypothetical protein